MTVTSESDCHLPLRWTAAAAAAFIVYRLTLAPGLTWANFGADGGELIAAAVTLGVPHPPGYPTYVLLGKLFSFLPVGTVAFRFNLFSAAATAFTAGFVALIAGEVSGINNGQLSIVNCQLSTISVGLLFAFAPLVWSQAVIAEVYGLNLAFLAAFLWVLLKGTRINADERGFVFSPFFCAGILLGLSLTTHLTSLLMVPLALFLTPRRRWARLGGGLALGLTPLLALPWLARTGSPIVWGDPTTWRGWLWLVSGQLYRPNLFAAADWQARLRDWGAILPAQFTLLGLPLILFAFYRMPPETRRPRWGLLATAVLYLLFAFGYASQDAIVNTLPALLLLAPLLAPALRRLGRLALLLPLILLLLNYNAMDLSKDKTIRPSAEHLLHEIPANAILLTPGDPTIFSLWYFQHVERQRPDLVLADANLFAFDWYRKRLGQLYPDLDGLEMDDLAAFQQANEGKRPFYAARLAPTNSQQPTASNQQPATNN